MTNEILGPSRKTASQGVALLVCGALTGPGTSAALSSDLYTWDEGTRTGFVSITSQSPCNDVYCEETRSAITEFRLLSGLTWDHVADIFGVSRRSVQNWASGKRMNTENETKLYEIRNVIRLVDTSSAATNRSKLLQKNELGASPLEMLKASQFNEAIAEMGAITNPRARVTGVSEDEVQRRKTPATPEQLLGAHHDIIHQDVAPARRVSKKRIRKG